MIQTPNTEPFEAEIKAIGTRVNSLKVISNEEYFSAAEELKLVKGAIKKVDAEFAESLDFTKRAYDSIRTLKKKIRDRYELIEASLKQKTTNFLRDEQQRQRDEAEKARREAEEQTRKATEVARKRQEDDRLAAAALMEAQGFGEEAEAIIAAPENPVIVAPVAIKLVPPPPKVEGVHLTTTWSAEVLDLKSLVVAVAEGRAPLAALTANTTFLNNQARALHHEMKIDGVRVVETHNTSSRAAFR